MSVENMVSGDPGSSPMQYTKWANLVELLLATVIQFFVPKIHWVSIYVIASIASNVMLVVDVFIFCLKVIDDLVEKCKIKMGK